MWCSVHVKLSGSASLTGTIPTQVGLLSLLTDFNIKSNNGVTGVLPSELGKLTLLTNLELQETSIHGQMPSELGHLTRLTRISWTTSQLSGTIPSQFGQMSSLTEIWGTNASGIGGSIPTQIGNMAQLQKLSLYGCNFTGTIPSQIGKLGNLLHLDMSTSNRYLSGSIPTEIGLTKLTYLAFAEHSMYGTIPSEIGLLTNLTALVLSEVLVVDTIPIELINLSNLRSIRLDANPIRLPENPVGNRICSFITSVASGNCGSTLIPSSVCAKCSMGTWSQSSSKSISPSESVSQTSEVTPTESITSTESMTSTESLTPTPSPSSSESETPLSTLSPSDTPSSSNFPIEFVFVENPVNVWIGDLFSFSITDLFYDPNGGSPTLEVLAAPSWAQLIGVQRLEGTPKSGDQGGQILCVRASDETEWIDREVIIFVQNRLPEVYHKIPDQKFKTGQDMKIISTNSFVDPDGDSLKIQVTQASGDDLPSWISTFSIADGIQITGIPQIVEVLSIKVLASDGLGNSSYVFRLKVESDSDLFQIAGFVFGPILSVLGIAACFMWREAIWDPFLPKSLRFVQGFETFEPLKGKRLRRVLKRVQIVYSPEPGKPPLVSDYVRIKRGENHETKLFAIRFRTETSNSFEYRVFEVKYGGDQPEVWASNKQEALEKFKMQCPVSYFCRAEPIQNRHESIALLAPQAQETELEAYRERQSTCIPASVFASLENHDTDADEGNH
eukprot:c9959_g1_i1.p1 GENE.c9959_g1_i1~~c9959_g1_i1.p1  ORF type:complete len:728 (-),score=104.37 c9959_g1_i1:72-2255(-)